MFLLMVYGIYFLIVCFVAASIFRWLKNRGIGRALLASGLGVALLALLYPIPVHGGFTCLVEIVLSELRSKRERLPILTEPGHFARISSRKAFGRCRPRLNCRSSGRRVDTASPCPY